MCHSIMCPAQDHEHFLLQYPLFSYIYIYIFIIYGPGSSFGIATDYGVDGPGSNHSGDEIFRQSRPALGPKQPPVKWVPGLSRGKVRPERAADYTPLF